MEGNGHRLNDILAHIDGHREQYLAELFPLLRQPSISATGEGMAACAELLAHMMEEAGMTARVLPTGGHPVVLQLPRSEEQGQAENSERRPH